MLVVIVVAAATAFSFFVASYQKQLQAQETLQHDKALEKIRILALEPKVNSTDAPSLAGLTVEVASLDGNPIVVTGMLLNGAAVLIYSVNASTGATLGSGCLNGNSFGSYNASCTLTLPPESQAFLFLELSPAALLTYAFAPGTPVALTESSVFTFQFLTSLGNEFTQSFVPPVAIAAVTFVDSNPILDGSNSYQPGSAASNVTLEFWTWTVSPSGDPDGGSYTGQEVELGSPLQSDVTYTIQLVVTNTESLVGSAEITYELT